MILQSVLVLFYLVGPWREEKKMERAIYFDGVGQRKSHSQRETFRDGDDQHGDTDNQELDKVVKIFVVPRLVLVNERLDTESRDQDDDGQDGDSRT